MNDSQREFLKIKAMLLTAVTLNTANRIRMLHSSGRIVDS